MRKVIKTAAQTIMEYMYPKGFELTVGTRFIIVPSLYYGRFNFGMIVEAPWKSPEYNYSMLLKTFEHVYRMKKVRVFVPYYLYLKYNLKFTQADLVRDREPGEEIEYNILPDYRFAIHYCPDTHVKHMKIMRVGQLGNGRVEEPLWAFKKKQRLHDDKYTEYFDDLAVRY